MVGYEKKEGFAGQKLCVIPDTVRRKAQLELLCKSLYLTDIGYYPKALFHARERRKGCQECILIYCIKGEGWCMFNNEKYKLTSSQLIVLPPNVPHVYYADKQNPWTIYWIHFSGENALEIIRHLLKGDSFKPVNVSGNEERNSLFDKLFSLAEVASNPQNLIDISICLPYYLTTFTQPLLQPKVSLSGNYDPVNKSIAFMKGNLKASLSLRVLAAHINLSKSHFSTLFKQKTNHSPISYFIFLKMQFACQMLKNTELTIKEIGQEVGYNDAFHFSRAFKIVIGTSPKGFKSR